MSIYLDLVRGLAAIAVLVGHGVETKLYTGPYAFTLALQHNAVVIFFVLSGLVISSSVQRDGLTLRSYLIARASRILPVSIPAVAFTSLVSLFGEWHGVSIYDTPSYNNVSVANVIFPLLFLSESAYGSGPAWNPAYWSLCYEVWYYGLFGAAIFLTGWPRLVALVVIALLAGANVLLLLPVWLLGVLVNQTASARDVSSKKGMALIVLSLAGFLLIGTQGHAILMDSILPLFGNPEYNFRFSSYAVSDLAIGLLIALHFVGVRAVISNDSSILIILEQPIRLLAGFSFTLYLFHSPILCLFYTLGLTAGDSIIAFTFILLLVAALCAAISIFTEQKRGAMRDFLYRMLSPARA